LIGEIISGGLYLEGHVFVRFLSKSGFMELLLRGTPEGARRRAFFLSLTIHNGYELTLLEAIVFENFRTQVKELLAI
jgi:hypothetical protein